MSRVRIWVAVASIGMVALLVPIAQSQPSTSKAKTTPALESAAETKLLMEGLAAPNMRALSKTLREKPTEAEAWNFARGQALLIAETGNLLVMRPPKTQSGQEAWMTQAVGLRDAGVSVARASAAKDYMKARTALAGMANVCNRCHQAFQVPSRIDPFGD